MLKAFILDDEPAIGRVVARVTEAAGFATEVMTEAEIFRQRFCETVPALVVLDLQMGPDDGIQQLRFLASQGYSNAIVLMSGFDGRVLEVAEQLGRQLGLNIAAAVSKPLRYETLQALFGELGSQLQILTPAHVLNGIEERELFLEYQPIVMRGQRTVYQAEALVRWNHPQRGRVGPDYFISLAERDDRVMRNLTDWVVGAAANASKELRDRGYDFPIAVNISSRDIESLDFPDRMHDLVTGAGVPTGAFCFEITETAASAEPHHSLDVITRLRLKGFALEIDDFGIGYSSLKRLRQLPFSTLKIDRSFVADAVTSKDSLTIVRSIIDLARNMELSTIAEGVEDETTARLLEDLGVDAMQGYLFARPMPLDKLLIWLSNPHVMRRAG